MARGRKPKANVNNKPIEGSVESYFWTEVTFVCPVRGKVTEKVKVKKLKPQDTPSVVPNYDLEILKEDQEDVD